MKGYVIFHRHGHRIPMKSLQGPFINSEVEELQLWKQFLPKSDRLEKLQVMTPIVNHPHNDIPKDLKTPYGRLTTKGMDYLNDKGRQLNEIFPSMKYTTLDVNKIKVYATNYQRTQVSVQELLNGMLIPLNNDSNNDIKIPINVRDITTCSMSYFDGKPKLAYSLVAKVQSTDKFKEIENDARALKAKEMLLSHVPLIVGPKGFDWMAALDYFACRRAHDITIHNDLLQYEEIVRQHMVSRYRVYLSHNEKFGHFVSPMIHDVNKQIKEYDENDNRTSSSLNIFSCHDVNLLGILYAVKANNINCPNFWPFYGDTLSFEYDSGDKINVYYNDKPLQMNNDSSKTYITKKELNELESRLIKYTKMTD